MKNNLHGNTTLITGASEGIGLATARLFASLGSDLYLLSRNEPRLNSLCDELSREFNVRCCAIAADVADVHSLRTALAALTLDITIVNAGIGLYGPVANTAWEDIERILSTNVSGAFATALPAMIARKAGSIIFISSVIGKRSVPYSSVYCASKFAVQGFADGLRLEAGRHGVHIGVVCPARTGTSFFTNMRYAVPQESRGMAPTSPPELVARDILRCVTRRKREVVSTLGGKLFSFGGYHFPRLSDAILRRAVPVPSEPESR
jgi:short-subunit dehydrogenase